MSGALSFCALRIGARSAQSSGATGTICVSAGGLVAGAALGAAAPVAPCAVRFGLRRRFRGAAACGAGAGAAGCAVSFAAIAGRGRGSGVRGRTCRRRTGGIRSARQRGGPGSRAPVAVAPRRARGARQRRRRIFQFGRRVRRRHCRMLRRRHRNQPARPHRTDRRSAGRGPARRGRCVRHRR